MDQMERDRSFKPPEGAKTAEPVRSPYFLTAMKAVREWTKDAAKDPKLQTVKDRAAFTDLPESERQKRLDHKEATIKDLLQDIDKQGVDHYRQYASKTDPATLTPVTYISVDQLAQTQFPNAHRELGNMAQKPTEKVVYVQTVGWSLPPAGSPFTIWDMAYDRAIIELPKVVSPTKRSAESQAVSRPSVEVHVIGSPNGFGGHVSETRVDRLKKEGFKPAGEDIADYIKDLKAQNDAGGTKTRFIIQGMSMGNHTAVEAAKLLKDAGVDVQMLLDNPVGYKKYRGLERLLGGPRVAWGFLAPNIKAMLTDEQVKTQMKADVEMRENLGPVLKASGIKTNESKAELKLKKSAAMIEGKKLVFDNQRYEANDQRYFIRKGMFDPTTNTHQLRQEARDVAKQAKKEHWKGPGIPFITTGKMQEFPINSSHFMNRFRAQRWGQVVDFCETLTEHGTPKAQAVKAETPPFQPQAVEPTIPTPEQEPPQAA